jgi:hypothetical protein
MVAAAYSEDLTYALPSAPVPRVQHGTANIAGGSAAFVAEQRARAAARQQRFASPKEPPPLQKTRIAWTGGKISSNKGDAVAAFIERKRQAGQLAPEDEERLRGSLQRRAAAVVVQTGAPVLAGRVFALSVGGDSVGQHDELAATIRLHGGQVSRTVHKKVDYVLASEQAVARNTQTVRKATHKFGIPLLRPAFVHACVQAGTLCGLQPHLHPPRRAAGAERAQPPGAPAPAAAAAAAAAAAMSVAAMSAAAPVARPTMAAQGAGRSADGRSFEPAPAGTAPREASRAALFQTARRAPPLVPGAGRRPQMPWLLRHALSTARWSGLACLELARYRRARRKYAARACAAAKSALRRVSA